MSAAAPLVDTAWLQERLGAPGVVVLEVDERPLLYRLGHVPGAHNVDWHLDLQDPVTRDIPDASAVERLWRRVGITADATVVLYGDKSNWYACFGAWLFRHYGLADVRVLDGGRQAWLAEGGPTTAEEPAENVVASSAVPAARNRLRATWRDVADGLSGGTQVLDVRTAPEYRGDVLTEPGYPDEAAQRPGHIPGALSVPWDLLVGIDGRIVQPDAARAILAEQGVYLDRPIIAYCRIGERSAHTWFVLREVLGLPDVRNYDGSWTEWGSMVGMPVALGDAPGEPVQLTALPGSRHR
jgi:thiosulfate/3-mercaptopyruvate sulfurtransferase